MLLYIHVYVCVYVCMCMCASVYISICIYMRLCLCVCMHVCLWYGIYVCLCACIYVRVRAKQKDPGECKHTGSKGLHQELLLGTALLEGKLEKTKENQKSDVRNLFPYFIKNDINKSRPLSSNIEGASLALKTSSSWIRPCYISFEGRVSIHQDSGC